MVVSPRTNQGLGSQVTGMLKSGLGEFNALDDVEADSVYSGDRIVGADQGAGVA